MSRIVQQQAGGKEVRRHFAKTEHSGEVVDRVPMEQATSLSNTGRVRFLLQHPRHHH